MVPNPHRGKARPLTRHGSQDQTWALTFRDDYENRTEIGDRYKTSRGHAEPLEKLLARTQSSAKISIQFGRWHTLRIRIRGDIMKAYLDDAMVASLRSPGFAHPTKNKFGFTVNGATIDFDNLSVRQPRAAKTEPE